MDYIGSIHGLRLLISLDRAMGAENLVFGVLGFFFCVELYSLRNRLYAC